VVRRMPSSNAIVRISDTGCTSPEIRSSLKKALLTAREAVRIFWTQTVAAHKCISRIRRVMVRVTKINVIRVFVIYVGRIIAVPLHFGVRVGHVGLDVVRLDRPFCCHFSLSGNRLIRRLVRQRGAAAGREHQRHPDAKSYNYG